MLAKAGPNGDTISLPSMCLQDLLLNIKNDSLITTLRKILKTSFPANIYLFKFNNKSTRKRCKIFSKLTIKTPEQRQANIYLLKFNNRSTRKRCEIFSKLTIKAPERCQRRRSGVFIVNFENISHLFLVLLLLTLNK